MEIQLQLLFVSKKMKNLAADPPIDLVKLEAFCRQFALHMLWKIKVGSGIKTGCSHWRVYTKVLFAKCKALRSDEEINAECQLYSNTVLNRFMATGKPRDENVRRYGGIREPAPFSSSPSYEMYGPAQPTPDSRP